MDHQKASERDKHFRKEYAYGGRDAPEACGRGAERKGGEAEMWKRELGRSPTHSKD